MNNRIERRTPCEAVLRGHRCTQEWVTHDAHRFNVSLDGSVEEILGKHQFKDPQSKDELQNILLSTIQKIKNVYLLKYNTFH